MNIHETSYRIIVGEKFMCAACKEVIGYLLNSRKSGMVLYSGFHPVIISGMEEKVGGPGRWVHLQRVSGIKLPGLNITGKNL